MEWLAVTLGIYRKVFTRAAGLAVSNWPLLGSVFVYSAIMTVTAEFAGFAGILGGFLLTLVWAACAGSFLYLVEMIVRTSKVTLDDFRRSFGVYLWDVVGVSFVFWIFFQIVRPVLLQLPWGYPTLLFVDLAVFILFNAVPELIYMGHYGSLALLTESYAFIGANWIEWFPANLIAAAVLFAVVAVPAGGPGTYLKAALLGLLLYFTMVMRGLLFIELHGSTHRGRVFKHRMRG